MLAASLSTQVVAAEFKLELKSDFAPRALVVDNKDGVWFPDGDAEYLLKLRTETVPDLVGVINSQQKTIDGLDLQLKLGADKDSLQSEQIKLLQNTLTSTEKELKSAVNKNTAWYYSNKLWAGIGFIAGILTTAYVVKSVR